MVFTSTIFLFYFLPLVLAAYYLLPRRGRNALLAIASYAFYGWWNPLFVLLLLASTLVDYSCGIRIDRSPAGSRQRKTALVTSVVTNLSILGFFKYYVFAIENINLVLMNLGHDPLASVAILLPVGISFYTFQSMSYTIDLYRGRVQVERSLVDFMAYVSLFPQLVAGPIVRYRDMASQLRDRRESLDAVAKGFCFFAIGFAKKVLIANPLGEVADTVFAASSPAWHVAWFGVTAYAFQIYFDFSGYSDMAIGLGRMFGFSIPQNFN
ncbi:MAG: MBOAT family O-acyltransferase, partial [Candidatus Binatia bacterium]